MGGMHGAGRGAERCKIAIAGTGYVGLGNGLLLAQHHEVVALDLLAEKVALLNAGTSPIEDSEVQAALRCGSRCFRATLNPEDAITALPMWWWPRHELRPSENTFDTRSVEAVVADVARLNLCRDGHQIHCPWANGQAPGSLSRTGDILLLSFAGGRPFGITSIPRESSGAARKQPSASRPFFSRAPQQDVPCWSRTARKRRPSSFSPIPTCHARGLFQ